MSETPVEPTEVAATPEAAAAAPASEMAEAMKATEINIQSLLEAGVHFGHQTHRWNPQMKHFIFGERNGTHIIDLDQTLPLFRKALAHVRELTSEGQGILFVGTKRQAAPFIEAAAIRAKQPFVNSRWLGGMMTNWKTVKKSIDQYKSMLEIQDDEEKREALSKKELARMSRACDKYAKSLAGMRQMNKLPAAIFVIDVGKEASASVSLVWSTVTAARRTSTTRSRVTTMPSARSRFIATHSQTHAPRAPQPGQKNSPRSRLPKRTSRHRPHQVAGLSRSSKRRDVVAVARRAVVLGVPRVPVAGLTKTLRRRLRRRPLQRLSPPPRRALLLPQ